MANEKSKAEQYRDERKARIAEAAKKNAKDIALNDFYMFIDEVWKTLNRYDIRVECEDVTWDVSKDEEMIYINEMLK